MLLDSRCLPCEAVEGMRTPPSGLNDCLEVCGDARNLGLNACDDGNIEDGDGCSGTCAQEPGFLCSGGSLSAPDTCVDIVAPSLKAVQVEGGTLAVTLLFSEPVRFSRQPLASDF